MLISPNLSISPYVQNPVNKNQNSKRPLYTQSQLNLQPLKHDTVSFKGGLNANHPAKRAIDVAVRAYKEADDSKGEEEAIERILPIVRRYGSSQQIISYVRPILGGLSSGHSKMLIERVQPELLEEELRKIDPKLCVEDQEDKIMGAMCNSIDGNSSLSISKFLEEKLIRSLEALPSVTPLRKEIIEKCISIVRINGSTLSDEQKASEIEKLTDMKECSGADKNDNCIYNLELIHESQLGPKAKASLQSNLRTAKLDQRLFEINLDSYHEDKLKAILNLSKSIDCPELSIPKVVEKHAIGILRYLSSITSETSYKRQIDNAISIVRINGSTLSDEEKASEIGKLKKPISAKDLSDINQEQLKEKAHARLLVEYARLVGDKAGIHFKEGDNRSKYFEALKNARLEEDSFIEDTKEQFLACYNSYKHKLQSKHKQEK